jgi:membrane protease YdiL (CAAX protease family)
MNGGSYHDSRFNRSEQPSESGAAVHCGAIYGWSRRWLSAWPAIILNGILFGVVSAAIGGDFVLVLRPILDGLVLNWIRERADSTLPGIAMHIANNTAVVISVYVLTGWR